VAVPLSLLIRKVRISLLSGNILEGLLKMTKILETVDPQTGEIFSKRRIRSAYDHDIGRSFHTPVVGQSMTKQEFKDSTDINNIVKHFTKTGRLDAFRQAEGKYVDFAQLPGSYQESLNLVQEANEAFLALPARTRQLFDNDVDQFLKAAASNPEAVFGRRDESGTLIAEPSPEPAPAPANPVPDPTAVS